MKKILFITIGCLSIVLGIIGIFVPGLPTTPFLLLSSWLFYKSSRRLHDALHRSKYLGPYICRYQDKKGVSLGSKLITIALMWVMISISAFGILENGHLRIVLLVAGAIGTGSVLYFVPTAKKAGKRDQDKTEDQIGNK